MKMFDFFGAQIWRLLAIAYLIVVVAIVFMKLKRGATLIDSQRLNMDPGTSSGASRAIRALGYRILLYPLVMLITNTAGILSQTHDVFSDTPNTFLDSWTMLTFPLVGLLNFIAFCFDPTVHNAVKVVYYRINKKPNDEMMDGATQVDMELNDINSRLEGGKGPDYYSNVYNSNEAFSALVKSL
ncbi:hypothetical protein K502DRAFT_354082 [Neoconidiobolus thromboides FSU 785]|nr:hypothetical protein K502DRAFT_354082 [Neoconidiobolus thromboides FSU 785]